MKDYVKKAIRTEAPITEEMKQRVVECIRLQHAADGMCTETGEFQDALKRFKYYGKEIDRVNLKEELGDMLWYIALACDELDTDIETVMYNNIAKLQARFPDKFNEHDVLNRDLDTERKILENG